MLFRSGCCTPPDRTTPATDPTLDPRNKDCCLVFDGRSRSFHSRFVRDRTTLLHRPVSAGPAVTETGRSRRFLLCCRSTCAVPVRSDARACTTCDSSSTRRCVVQLPRRGCKQPPRSTSSSTHRRASSTGAQHEPAFRSTCCTNTSTAPQRFEVRLAGLILMINTSGPAMAHDETGEWTYGRFVIRSIAYNVEE